MNWSLYIDRRGWLHEVDPRAKLVLLLSGFVVPFLYTAPTYTGATCAAAMVVLVSSGCTANLTRMRVLYVVFLVATTILWAVFRPGPTVVWWRLSEEGLLYGLGAGLKIIAGMTSGLTFLGTTTNEEMARGLVGLGVPYRAAFTMALAFQMIPGLIATGLAVRDAQVARGLPLDRGGPWARARAHVPLLVPALLATLRQSDQLAMALECRGFGAGRRRTWLYEARTGAREVGVLVASAVYIGAGITVRALGLGLHG